MAASVVGPAVGTVADPAWAEHRSHDLLYPLTVQQVSASREVGSIRSVRCGEPRSWPPTAATSAPEYTLSPLLLVVLIVVCWRRWPASFTAYAVAVVVVGLSARNLDSLERYSLSTVPLVLAAADITGSGSRERAVFVASARSSSPVRSSPSPGCSFPERTRYRLGADVEALDTLPPPVTSARRRCKPGRRPTGLPSEMAERQEAGVSGEHNGQDDFAVVVIGAGPAGLTAAYQLGRQAGAVIVVEATASSEASAAP